MSVLEAHRARVAALNDALARLEALHEEAYVLWDRIVRLSEGDDPHRREQIDALHDEAFALAERTVQLREETFGTMERRAHLALTNAVESLPVAAGPREVAPLPGE